MIEANKQGNTRNKQNYDDLDENTKEYDRVLARYVLSLAIPNQKTLNRKQLEDILGLKEYKTGIYYYYPEQEADKIIDKLLKLAIPKQKPLNRAEVEKAVKENNPYPDYLENGHLSDGSEEMYWYEDRNKSIVTAILNLAVVIDRYELVSAIDDYTYISGGNVCIDIDGSPSQVIESFADKIIERLKDKDKIGDEIIKTLKGE